MTDRRARITWAEVETPPNGAATSTVVPDAVSGTAPAAPTDELSWSHSFGAGDDRAAFCIVSVPLSVAAVDVVVEVGFQPMTRLTQRAAAGSGGGTRVLVFHLAGPPVGSFSFVVSLPVPVLCAAGALSLHGVSGTDPIQDPAGVSGQNDSPTINMPMNDGDFVMGAIALFANEDVGTVPTVDAASGQTLHFAHVSTSAEANNRGAVLSTFVAGEDATPVSWQISEAVLWTSRGFVVNPASFAPPPPPPPVWSGEIEPIVLPRPRRFRSPVVTLRRRFFLADRHGVKTEEITPALAGGKVTVNLEGQTVMSLLATLHRPHQFRPFTDFVIPELSVDGGPFEPVGLFAVMPPGRRHVPAFTSEIVDGRDLTWLLDVESLPEGFVLETTTGFIAAARSLLVEAGFAPGRIVLPDITTTPEEPVVWDPGVRRGRVIRDLLDAVACTPVTPDRFGFLIGRRRQPLCQEEVARDWTSASGEEIVGEVADEPDLSRLANRVVVIAERPGDDALFALRENKNPASPTSRQALGFWVGPGPHKDPNLQDQATVDALADAMLSEGASYLRQVTLRTVPDPTRNPREIYRLDLHNKHGLVAEGRMRSLGYELALGADGGPMVHKLARIEPIGQLLAGGPEP